MSNITPLFASYRAKPSSSSNRSNPKPQATSLTPELRAGLDELKRELQVYLDRQERT
jgi:hypothetical protein